MFFLSYLGEEVEITSRITGDSVRLTPLTGGSPGFSVALGLVFHVCPDRPAAIRKAAQLLGAL